MAKKRELDAEVLSALRQEVPVFLPRGTGLGVIHSANLGNFVLDPLEADCLSRQAGEKRRTEFALGRAAAHEALSRIGLDSGPVLKGKRGEPLWPGNVTGSISHKGGAAVALAGSRNRFRWLGIDLESDLDPISPGIARRICTSVEGSWLYSRPQLVSRRIRMVFSAKESVFKAVNQAGGVFLGFQDMELSWSGDESCFEARLSERKSAKGGIPRTMAGRCFRRPGVIMTFLAVS